MYHTVTYDVSALKYLLALAMNTHVLERPIKISCEIIGSLLD